MTESTVGSPSWQTLLEQAVRLLDDLRVSDWALGGVFDRAIVIAHDREALARNRPADRSWWPRCSSREVDESTRAITDELRAAISFVPTVTIYDNSSGTDPTVELPWTCELAAGLIEPRLDAGCGDRIAIIDADGWYVNDQVPRCATSGRVPGVPRR